MTAMHPPSSSPGTIRGSRRGRRSRRGRGLAAVALVCLLLSGGCLQIEYGLVLNRDLSGTANIDALVNLESMAYVAARMQRMFSGRSGEPTEQEIAQAREEMIAQADRETPSEAELREDIESDLPDGVTLLSAENVVEGLHRGAKVRVRFDHIERLNDVTIQPGDESDPAGPPESEPFGDLRVVDEGETLLITNAPLDPLQVQEEVMGPMGGGEMEGMVREAFRDLRVAFSIQTPFEVVEHNATRVDGDVLWWEFDLESFMGPESAAADHIRVRYRK